MATKKTSAKSKSRGRTTASKPRPGGAAAAKRSAKTAGATRATARKPARAVAKVSPLRGMPVESWINTKTKGWQSEVVRRVLQVVQRAAPGASCSIKWGQPVFEDNGPFAFVRPARAHLSVGFWRGAEVKDPKGLLERGDRMGHFKVRGPDELDEGALAAMVKDAVRLNREKGSPTMRG